MFFPALNSSFTFMCKLELRLQDSADLVGFVSEQLPTLQYFALCSIATLASLNSNSVRMPILCCGLELQQAECWAIVGLILLSGTTGF